MFKVPNDQPQSQDTQKKEESTIRCETKQKTMRKRYVHWFCLAPAETRRAVVYLAALAPPGMPSTLPFLPVVLVC